MGEAERATTKVRERTWVDKLDHTGDAPRLVERQLFEDGVLVQTLTGEEVPADERAAAEAEAATPR